MVEYKDVKPGDSIEFKCRGCAKCCKDVGGILVVEPSDAYKLAKYLTSIDESIEVYDIYYKYCRFIPLDEYGIGAFVMKDNENQCIFLDGDKCSIYDGRPRICRIYPFACSYNNKKKKLRYQLSYDNHIQHFSGGEYVVVRDWFRENLDRGDKFILDNSIDYIRQLVKLMMKVGDAGTLEKVRMEYLTYYFLNYNLEEDFIVQYRRNMVNMLDKVKRIVSGGV